MAKQDIRVDKPASAILPATSSEQKKSDPILEMMAIRHSLQQMGISDPLTVKKEDAPEPIEADLHEIYPGAETGLRNSDMGENIRNLERMASVAKSGGQYQGPTGNFNLNGFSLNEFKRQGNSANWAGVEVNLPKVKVEVNLPKVKIDQNLRLDGSFQQAHQIVLAAEGGYSNHVSDRGGATIFGIASKANPKEFKEIMTAIESGDKAGALQIAQETYYNKYWKPAGVEKLTDPSARLIAYDMAVNSGVGAAKKMIEQTNGDADQMIKYRANLYQRIIANDPSQQAFEKGWNNRLAKLDAIEKNQDRFETPQTVASQAIDKAKDSSRVAVATGPKFEPIPS